MLCGGGKVGKPAGFGAVIEFGQVTLAVAKGSQVAGLRVGIEAGRRFVPAAMAAQMDFGIEPIAPADNGAAAANQRKTTDRHIVEATTPRNSARRQKGSSQSDTVTM